MRFRDARVSDVLVGVDRVGIVGLRDALRAAEASGVAGRDAVVDFLLEKLAADNYIRDPRDEAYRTMLWREYLRFRGEDFSDFLSEVAVEVRGDAGDERDRFAAMLRSLFRELELKPTVHFTAAGDDGPHPQLVIGDDVLARGPQSRERLKTAIRTAISHW